MSTSDNVIEEIYILPQSIFEKLDEGKKNYLLDPVALWLTGKGGVTTVKLLNLFGLTVRAYVKVVKGKKYLIFKGPRGLRPNFPGTRYLRTNPKLAMFVVGTREIIEDSAKALKYAVIAYVALDVMQEILEDHFSIARLGVKVASDIAQALISTAVGVGAAVAYGAIVVAAGGVAMPVVAFAIVVGVGFVAGMGLTWIDQKFHLTDMAVERMMELERQTKEGLAELGGRIEDRIGEAIRRTAEDAAYATGRYAADRLRRLMDEWLYEHLYPYRLR